MKVESFGPYSEPIGGDVCCDSGGAGRQQEGVAWWCSGGVAAGTMGFSRVFRQYDRGFTIYRWFNYIFFLEINPNYSLSFILYKL